MAGGTRKPRGPAPSMTPSTATPATWAETSLARNTPDVAIGILARRIFNAPRRSEHPHRSSACESGGFGCGNPILERSICAEAGIGKVALIGWWAVWLAGLLGWSVDQRVGWFADQLVGWLGFVVRFSGVGVLSLRTAIWAVGLLFQPMAFLPRVRLRRFLTPTYIDLLLEVCVLGGGRASKVCSN